MGAAATGFPLMPSGYVAGTITLSDSLPHSLLALVQAQLDQNAAGAGYEVNLQTDASGALYVGRFNAIGALSSTNYGYQLPAGGSSRTYRSGFPGAHSPVGDIQVLMVGGGTFHIEYQ
jgi:hypothetical protein